MDLELTLPATHVRLHPGLETRATVVVRNPRSDPAVVRISVARGRAAAWARSDPPELTVAAGASADVEIVVVAPAEQPPSAALIPFVVRADDVASGEPAGFVSGLLTVAAPERVTGELTPGPAGRFAVHLRSHVTGSLAVRLSGTLDPPNGTVTATPEIVALAAGGAATATVTARARRPIVGRVTGYGATVVLHDASAGAEVPPLAELTAEGTVRPWLTTRAATILGLVVLGLATGAMVLLGGDHKLPGHQATASGGAPASAAVLLRPYVVVEVFPHRGADGGRSEAEAARDRLAAAGMTVRTVDSLGTELLSDEGGGFWVVVQDGFPDTAQAQAYCDRFRAVAPKCRVTS